MYGRGMRGVALLLVASLLAALIGALSAPVRADVTSIAVVQFENHAGAPSSVIDALSNALYRAVAASPNYRAKGGGPLVVKAGIARDPMGADFEAAAAAGADHMLVGDVVAYGGGSVTFRLEAYRVNPLALVRTRSFTHTYPPVNSEALSAALNADVAALEAPRAGTATIYMVTPKEIDADVGSADGFHINQHFNIVRNGRKVGEATIVTIYDAYGIVDISNAAPDYHPAIGDRLVSQESQPALVTTNNRSGVFEPLYFIVAAAAALIALGKKGSVGPFPTPSPLPSGSAAPFTVSGFQNGGTHQLPQFEFVFSQPVSSSSQTSMLGTATFAFWQFTPNGGSPGGQNTLQSLGTCSAPPTCFINANTLVLTDNNQPLNSVGDALSFTFTSSITSATGQPLVGATINFPRTSSVGRRPLVAQPQPGTIGLPPGNRTVPGAPNGSGVPNGNGAGLPNGGQKPPAPNTPQNPH